MSISWPWPWTEVFFERNAHGFVSADVGKIAELTGLDPRHFIAKGVALSGN